MSNREEAEMLSKVIIRKVKVNRNRTPLEAIVATGRSRQYTDRKVVDSMPKGEGDEVEVVFFKPEPHEYTCHGFMSSDDLENAFNRRDLKPADPISVAAVNEADPAFADDHSNGTQWKDEDGRWCCCAFDCRPDGRIIRVHRDVEWRGPWWFGGEFTKKAKL